MGGRCAHMSKLHPLRKFTLQYIPAPVSWLEVEYSKSMFAYGIEAWLGTRAII